MKAAVCERYGPPEVVQIREVPTPVPADGEVLVEAVGRAVSGFQPGDRVVASRGFDVGCHADYVTVAEQGAIARIPESLSHMRRRPTSSGGRPPGRRARPG